MKFAQFVLVFCGVLLVTGLPCAVADTPLLLGIHPYKTPSRLLAAFTPLADYLSKGLGRRVEIRISPDYQSHIQAIGEDRLDIAYLGPASYIALTEKYGEKPLLAKQVIHGKATFRGAIIARSDSTIRSLAELKGKRFAFGDPESTMSSLLPRYMLLQAGIRLEDLAAYRFLGSHNNVALGVLSGDFDAGGVKEAVYKKYRAKGLKLVTYTPEIAEHLFVASKRMDRSRVKRIGNLLLALDKSANGRKIMEAIKPGMTAMVRVKDSDYQTLRDILRTLKRADGDSG
ncbi:phosphonate transport system substrate-binding protein [Thiogranum longum]|uniref:Phosphonate transport system substrate-binding protein n=1 Tax=Thiogranum longum TaxID=1537524 RepID=A0A4R1HE48_9GAMM|nr:phosphate/phosphite/phosphonate ABC transporter substrate-binding protein [Thiogranum longum]TCK18585.1 phosphonate transport system substrate-binding protein [Thiogranum longum]